MNKHLIEGTFAYDGQEIFQINQDQFIKNLMRQFSEELELVDVTFVSNDNLNFTKNLDQINPMAIRKNKN